VTPATKEKGRIVPEYGISTGVCAPTAVHVLRRRGWSYCGVKVEQALVEEWSGLPLCARCRPIARAGGLSV
jgi:hypothetical protein